MNCLLSVKDWLVLVGATGGFVLVLSINLQLILKLLYEIAVNCFLWVGQFLVWFDLKHGVLYSIVDRVNVGVGLLTWNVSTAACWFHIVHSKLRTSSRYVISEIFDIILWMIYSGA